MKRDDEAQDDDGRAKEEPPPAGAGEVPNPETGAGIGAGEPSTFEPEEDPEATTDPT